MKRVLRGGGPIPMAELDDYPAPDGTVHEKQSLQLCAVHCTNNLLQLGDDNMFTRADFNHIAAELAPNAWINPHKSMLGLGNYDANVLIVAIQKRGFDYEWYDRREKITPESMPVGTDETIVGLICNRPTRPLMGLLRGAHWYTIRPLEDKFYNLDSYLSKPQAFADNAAVRLHLQALLDSSDEANVLVIRRKPENPYAKENYRAAAASADDDSEANSAAGDCEEQTKNGSAEKLESYTQQIDE